MLEVAVIGAGTSGLVASRYLASMGLRPIIFEAASSIGGAWSASLSRKSTSGFGQINDNGTCDPATQAYGRGTQKMWDGLTTNLSKHTCRFSDWPWPEDSPTFPTVDDMNKYLESYAETFISKDSFQFDCLVTSINSLTSNGCDYDDENDRPNGGYKVQWKDFKSETDFSKEFHGVILATGFFSKPRLPGGLEMFEEVANKTSFISHSMEYRSHHEYEDESVVVVGSSFSALEIAADVSRSARKVVSILPSIPWVVPRYLPVSHGDVDVDKGTTTSVLPVDLAFYRRKKDAPELPEQSFCDAETSRVKHSYLKSILGSRQGSSRIGIPKNFDNPPLVAISDRYLDLVLDEKIDVVHGRLEVQQNDGDSEETSTKTIKINPSSDDDGEQSPFDLPDEISKIICCTGYQSNLEDLLGDSILEKVDYDARDNFSPATLCWDTLHPDLPNMAFCGMYKGPYMGIMELQGRLAAGVLSGKVPLSKEQYDEALKTSRDIRSRRPRAQFPHFDYLGFMDTLLNLLPRSEVRSGEESVPRFNVHKGDMVTPAFYQSDDRIAKECQKELIRQVRKGRDGSLIPNMVVSALVGSWDFNRNISHLSPSDRREERVDGTIRYSFRREDSSSNGSSSYDCLLYREDGLYQFSPTKVFNVFREYEYQAKDDCLEIYFVEGGNRAHLFLSLKFTKQQQQEQCSSSTSSCWIATSDHLCIKDLYKGRFQVKFEGTAATEIVITYRVKGPEKDYESTTVLTPRREQ